MTNYYDQFGQPTTILQTMDGHFRYVSYYHDDAGNLVRLTHPDGIHFGYGYDALGRMTLLLDNPAFTSIDDIVLRYWYKPEGGRHAAVRGAGSVGFTTVFYYDELLRPVAFYNDLPTPGNDVNVGLAYNPASQIVSRSVSNDSYAAPTAANVARGYQVNGLNQYSGTTHGGAPNWSFEHDPNGNLKRSIDPAGALTTSYLYDVENRLVAASGAANATLVYDPLGRLVQVTNAAGAQTHFLYDGDRMIAEYDGSGNLLKRYVHGPGADEPVAVYDGAALGLANRRYMLADERASIAALITASGSPSVVNTYDPWGIPGAGNGGRFGYTGQAWIPELGMYYYKARIYSATLGRFLQVDPIGYEDQINLYVYVRNDPINHADPTGETCTHNECWADTTKAANVNVVANPADNAIAQANMSRFVDPVSVNIRTGEREEPVGAGMPNRDGTTTVRMLNSSTRISNDSDKQRVTIPGAARFVQHGHLKQDDQTYTVVDSPETSGGRGDSATLMMPNPKPNYTVAYDRLGVRDAPGGILHFKMLVGTMTRSERQTMSDNINREQRVLERYWRSR